MKKVLEDSVVTLSSGKQHHVLLEFYQGKAGETKTLLLLFL